MTPTEQRLADALTDAAGAIREEALRELVAGTAVRPLAWRHRALRSRAPRLPGRSGWLVPAAAAAAILAVVGLVVGIARSPRLSAPAIPDAATASAPPPYYVSIDGADGDVVTVRRTATGRVTDSVPPPPGWRAVGPSGTFDQGLEPSAIAASQDRVFVVAYDNPDLPGTGLYRFGLTSAGKVTGFTQVPGGKLAGLVDITLAMSPDGSHVAVAGIPAPRIATDNPHQAARIDVVDLRTGSRRVWQGGMSEPGQQFSIPSLSWTADGNSLVYVGLWCGTQLAYPNNESCYVDSLHPERGVPVTAVREIRAAGPAALDDGPVLLRGSARYPEPLQAMLAPDGQLVAMVLRGWQLRLVRFAVPGGHPGEVVYDGAFVSQVLRSMEGLGSAGLASDGSGRYLILNLNDGVLSGWVHRGRFHPLGGEELHSTAW